MDYIKWMRKRLPGLCPITENLSYKAGYSRLTTNIYNDIERMCSIMKRAFIIFITLLLVTSAFSYIPSEAAAAKVKVSVTLSSIECESNDHVGNEWGFGCTVNKKTLDEGDSMDVEITSAGKITLVCKAVEDDSIPDVGTKTLTIPVSKLSAGQTKEYTVRVTVRENRGRYSGNTAVWNFNFDVKKE